jgi:hypothetical protein
LEELVVTSVFGTDVLKAVTLVTSVIDDAVVNAGVLVASSSDAVSETRFEMSEVNEESDEIGEEKVVETSDDNVMAPVASEVEAGLSAPDVSSVVPDVGAGATIYEVEGPV